MTAQPTGPDDLFPGPIDDASWPARLKGHVATPGPRARLHGYDVEEDLAKHYSFVETALLALTGELPAAGAAAAVERALVFLAPAPISEAPAHATLVTELCGPSSGSLLGVGALALAEQARALVETPRAGMAWLRHPDGPPPEELAAADDEERAAVERLRQAVAETGFEVAALSFDLGREAALLAVLTAAGLWRAEQLEALVVMARLPCVVAEALSTRPRRYRDYSMNLPRFEYREER